MGLLGALIGAGIDREDGDSGIKGAIIGTVAETAIRVALPLAFTFAVGWAVTRGAKAVWGNVSGTDRD